VAVRVGIPPCLAKVNCASAPVNQEMKASAAFARSAGSPCGIARVQTPLVGVGRPVPPAGISAYPSLPATRDLPGSSRSLAAAATVWHWMDWPPCIVAITSAWPTVCGCSGPRLNRRMNICIAATEPALLIAGFQSSVYQSPP
jgi:hypothetical protein